MSTRSFFLAAAVALTCAASAQASPAVTTSYRADQLSVRVSLADLDLRKDAGATVALQRIRHAARIVCGSERLSPGVDRYIRYQACLKTTLGHAVASLDAKLAAGPDSGSASPLLRLAANR